MGSRWMGCSFQKVLLYCQGIRIVSVIQISIRNLYPRFELQSSLSRWEYDEYKSWVSSHQSGKPSHNLVQQPDWQNLMCPAIGDVD
jgi:hypothetical protein